jgi:hypothetical protein
MDPCLLNTRFRVIEKQKTRRHEAMPPGRAVAAAPPNSRVHLLPLHFSFPLFSNFGVLAFQFFRILEFQLFSISGFWAAFPPLRFTGPCPTCGNNVLALDSGHEQS